MEEVGKIIEESETYMQLEKGSIKKETFWIPKFTAENFDGKTLRLRIASSFLDTYRWSNLRPPD